MGWQPEWDVWAITDSGWMMDDRTVFKGVMKLMPGHWMEITEEEGVEIHKYWDAEYPDKVCYYLIQSILVSSGPLFLKPIDMIWGADTFLLLSSDTDQPGPPFSRGNGPRCP